MKTSKTLDVSKMPRRNEYALPCKMRGRQVFANKVDQADTDPYFGHEDDGDRWELGWEYMDNDDMDYNDEVLYDYEGDVLKCYPLRFSLRSAL